jgi:enamine deaminase RidA (YjgF/YER057c/UK114 family)
MPTPSQRLAALGLKLPTPSVPAYNYVPATVHGKMMYVSGQVPKEDGEVKIVGTLGLDIDIEEARHAAEICAMQCLSCAAEVIGGLDHIDRVLRLTGYVASAPNFHQQPRVIDAASALISQVFGDDGRHARTAIGVASLPLRSPVEIELILSLK